MRMVMLIDTCLHQDCIPSELKGPNDIRFDIVPNHDDLIDRSADLLKLFFGEVERVGMWLSIDVDFKIMTID